MNRILLFLAGNTAIGSLWERGSGGRALFLMPTKERSAPAVREQVERKFKQTA